MRISKIAMAAAIAGLSIGMLTASAPAQSLGGLLGVGGGNDGLVNVDVGGTKISVLPDADSVAESVGLGGAGAGISSNSGGSVAGVSLGGGSQDSHTVVDLGGGKATLSLGRSNGGGTGGNGNNGGGGRDGSNGANGGNGGSGINGRNGVQTASTGGSDRDSSTPISRLHQLNQLILGTNLRNAASLRCAANIEVVRLNRWLPRGERSELPTVISRNAVKIGSMQNAFANDPNLDCILRAARLKSNRLIAVDQRGDTLWLLII